MKQYINKCSVVALCSVIITGCADTDIANFSVEKPNSIAEMEYLNEYDALKTYVNSSANPNFKLGIALTADDYIASGRICQSLPPNWS